MIPGFKEIKKGTKLITKKQKLLHKSLQDGVLDIDAVENFFEEYDHHGSIGWLQEILNGNINLDLMRQAIWCHLIGNKTKCQRLVDDMFIVRWWEKEENQNEY